jgi:hypothetical protein
MGLNITPNVLLGIQHKPFDKPPTLELHRYRIYERGKISIIPPEDQKLNLNYQIEGSQNEKLVVRLFKNKEGVLYRGSYYSINEFDSELAEYLIRALIQKLKIPSIDIPVLPLKKIILP